MVNSPRISFFTKNDADRDRASATAVNPSHHSGIRHQSGYSRGEKSSIRLASTSKGRDMSMASVDRKARVCDGTRFLPIIQKPSTPMPRRANTACNVIRNTFMLLQFYMAQSTLTSCAVSSSLPIRISDFSLYEQGNGIAARPDNRSSWTIDNEGPVK